jgi:hypothetical protein
LGASMRLKLAESTFAFYLFSFKEHCISPLVIKLKSGLCVRGSGVIVYTL